MYGSDGTSAEFYGDARTPLAWRWLAWVGALSGLAAVVVAVVEACR